MMKVIVDEVDEICTEHAAEYFYNSPDAIEKKLFDRLKARVSKDIFHDIKYF